MGKINLVNVSIFSQIDMYIPRKISYRSIRKGKVEYPKQLKKRRAKGGLMLHDLKTYYSNQQCGPGEERDTKVNGTEEGRDWQTAACGPNLTDCFCKLRFMEYSHVHSHSHFFTYYLYLLSCYHN